MIRDFSKKIVEDGRDIFSQEEEQSQWAGLHLPG